MTLVGDSAAMVVHGQDTTLPMTLHDMITHCQAVKRGTKRTFVVGDLPLDHTRLVRTMHLNLPYGL